MKQEKPANLTIDTITCPAKVHVKRVGLFRRKQWVIELDFDKMEVVGDEKEEEKG